MKDDGDALVAEAARRAQERWPELREPAAALRDGLARHPPADLDELKARSLDDLLLASACGKGDRAALAELDRRLAERVPRWLDARARSHADEVAQLLRQRLLTGDAPRIAGYNGTRPLDAWLRVAALRCALDLRGAEKPGGSDGLEALPAGPDPELDAMKVLDGRAFRALLHDALGSLPSRERALLRLHYLNGLSLEKLAQIERVHRATVARRLAEARALALERVRELMAERLRLSAADGDSLVRALRSRLGDSLRLALESAAPT